MKQKAFIYTIIIFFISLTGNSQSFDYVGDSPFGIEIANFESENRLALKYIFEDADGDGDKDLFLFGLDDEDTTSYHPSFIARLRYFIEFQENIGDKHNPQFAPREKKFESFELPRGKSFVLPDVGDINGDQMQDFFICSEVDEYSLQFPLIYLQQNDQSYNKSLCTDWNLDPINNYSFFIPELTDLDMDGDLDILMSGYMCHDLLGEEQVNTFLYAKNTGTLTNPEFLGWFENPYGLEPAEYNQMLSAGDLDLDGDMDILSISQTEDIGTIEFFENTPGTNGKLSFKAPIPILFGLPQPKHENDAYLFPSLTDIDGDGDIDIFFFRQEEIDEETTNVTLEYYENKICNFDINTAVFESGSVLTAHQDASYNYQWFDCNTGEDITNATSYEFEAPYSGSFGVSIIDSRGCKDESDCYDVIASNINDASFTSKIDVFPNPSGGQINLINRRIENIKEIIVYNIHGVKVAKINSDFDKIDLSGNRQGLYLIKIVFDDVDILKEIILTN